METEKTGKVFCCSLVQCTSPPMELPQAVKSWKSPGITRTERWENSGKPVYISVRYLGWGWGSQMRNSDSSRTPTPFSLLHHSSSQAGGIISLLSASLQHRPYKGQNQNCSSSAQETWGTTTGLLAPYKSCFRFGSSAQAANWLSLAFPCLACTQAPLLSNSAHLSLTMSFASGPSDPHFINLAPNLDPC